MAYGFPVSIIAKGGAPFTQVAKGPVATVVQGRGVPITLVPNAAPIALFNPDGTPYTTNPFPQTSSILGAGGLDYAFFDSGLAASMFQDAAGTIPAAQTNPVGRWNVRDKAPHFGSQSVGGQRPVLQSDGLKFDGSDDNLLTDWLLQNGDATMMVDCVLPASLSGTKAVAGNSAVAGEFAYLGFDATTGQVRRGWGSSNLTVGGPDFRGQRVIVALSLAAGMLRTFANGALLHEVASVGVPNLTRALRLGAASDGSNLASLLFPGSISKAAFARVGIDANQSAQLYPEWLAAA